MFLVGVYIIVLLQLMASLFILLYGFSQFYLVLKAKRKKAIEPIGPIENSELPQVTVQLPVYNEKYVVERLIDAVCNLKYPHNKLEIQVLDDSDDETITLCAKKVNEYKSKGFDIVQIRRTDRIGYKAGALQVGLLLAKGEYIAILDADFVPQADFLQQLIPHFTTDTIGMVQARWGHLNENTNMLTKLQAFGLDAHFNIEQAGRSALEGFINFNGTAGIWRKKCIQSVGGWQHDTLTEDLDLSYRAQLAGWKMHYVNEIIVPAELPPVLKALQNQQFRWTKGAAQNLLKHGKSLWQSNLLQPIAKLMAFFHLSNSLVFIAVLSMALTTLPMLFIKHYILNILVFKIVASFFVPGMVFLILFYWNAYQPNNTSLGKKILDFSGLFPLFLAFSMGLSLHNSTAVIQGLLGKKSPFIRTPKVSNSGSVSDAIQNSYFKRLNTFSFPKESLFTLYFLISFVLSIRISEYAFIPFIVLLIIGFGSISVIRLSQYFTMKF